MSALLFRQRLLGFLALTVVTLSVQTAAASWEAAVLFFSNPSDPIDFQYDIDRNVMELARVVPGPDLKLSIYREWATRSVTYFPDPTSQTLTPWDGLFEKVPVAGIPVAGGFTQTAITSNGRFLKNPVRAEEFFKEAFPSPDARKILIIQTHGEGPTGFKLGNMRAIKKLLAPFKTRPLDILWLDSCLMMNIETVIDLASYAKFIIAPQDTEFSAGAPFDQLGILLKSTMPVESIATKLALRHVESYSVHDSGSQQDVVFSSPATVSVIETARLVQLLPDFKSVWKEFFNSTPLRKKRIKTVLPRYTMENGVLVDLPSLLRLIGKPESKRLSRIFGVGTPREKRTNARIRIEPPSPGLDLVYGYQGFGKGDSSDLDTRDLVPTSLKTSRFSPGPFGKMWPTLKMEKPFFVAPFSPGLNGFGFYFQNAAGQIVSQVRKFVRLSDYVSGGREDGTQPIVVYGYTQGQGTSAEKYSGLSVLSPFADLPNLDYLDSAFFKATRWTQEP